jgi:hypothetical protein
VIRLSVDRRKSEEGDESSWETNGDKAVASV